MKFSNFVFLAGGIFSGIALANPIASTDLATQQEPYNHVRGDVRASCVPNGGGCIAHRDCCSDRCASWPWYQCIRKDDANAAISDNDATNVNLNDQAGAPPGLKTSDITTEPATIPIAEPVSDQTQADTDDTDDTTANLAVRQNIDDCTPIDVGCGDRCVPHFGGCARDSDCCSNKCLGWPNYFCGG